MVLRSQDRHPRRAAGDYVAKETSLVVVGCEWSRLSLVSDSYEAGESNESIYRYVVCNEIQKQITVDEAADHEDLAPTEAGARASSGSGQGGHSGRSARMIGATHLGASAAALAVVLLVAGTLLDWRGWDIQGRISLLRLLEPKFSV